MWNNRIEKIFSEFTNGYDFVLIIENEKISFAFSGLRKKWSVC